MSLCLCSLSRMRERAGVRVVFQCPRNHLQHCGQLRHSFVVPEPQHLPALALQELGSTLVIRGNLILGMLPTVQLHHQMGLNAGDIRDLGAKGVLATELEA